MWRISCILDWGDYLESMRIVPLKCSYYVTSLLLSYSWRQTTQVLQLRCAS